MKKIFAIGLVLILMVSMAQAATKLSTVNKDGEDGVYLSIWADPKATPTGIVNALGTSKILGLPVTCNEGTVYFDTITGTGIMNVALQTSNREMTLTPQGVPSTLFNTIGSTSTPYHQVDPSDTDTLKFDFNSRGFDYWTINCLAGCTLTNYIEKVFGECWREGK